jgi:molecular chaperone DnaK
VDQTQGAIGLAVKLPFATREEFVAKYGANLSAGGIYLRARSVKPPGTPIALELKLANGERLLAGSAVVDFVTGQKGQGVVGMGLRFKALDEASQAFLSSILVALPHGKLQDPPLPPGVGPADTGAAPGEAVQAPPSAPTLTPSGPPALEAAPGPGSTGPRRSEAPSAPTISAPAFEEPTEEPKRTGPIIGIDLGTTNSCAAIVKNNKSTVLYSREGYNTVPSIIALNSRGKLVVGHPAKGQMLTNPRHTVYGAKRLVGRQFESPLVQHIKDKFHYEIAPGKDGEAAVKLGDRVYSLQQISSLVLREVREIAQNQLGQPVSRAVITVPAYYNDNQRQAVREAGRLAGLHVERIVNEPTAAALAFGYGRRLTQRILVYDLGGGTFDASVLELNDNVYEVISTGGDTFLGGIDFDNTIVAFLLEEFKKKHSREMPVDRVAMQRITDAAERAKCQLSERTEVRIHVPFVTMIENQPYDLDVTLTREKLVELTGALVERTITVCDEILKAKNLTAKDIDDVVLVGGQSRFPLVHEKVTKYFNKLPSKGVHADEAVAMGAALLANSLGQIDVLPMAIGIGLPGGRFKAILDRNTALPATKRYSISTSRDDQTEVELSIFQGDNAAAQQNEYLGTLKLAGLPKKPRGGVQIEVVFEVNNECLLKVTAKESGTDKSVTSVFSTRDTPAAVKARLENDGGAKPSPAPPAGATAQKSPTRSATPTQLPNAAVAAASQAQSAGGLFGWFKRLFGR